MSMKPPEPNVTPWPTSPATKLIAEVAEGLLPPMRSFGDPSMLYQLTVPGGTGVHV
jgi:hypothetical protein